MCVSQLHPPDSGFLGVHSFWAGHRAARTNYMKEPSWEWVHQGSLSRTAHKRRGYYYFGRKGVKNLSLALVYSQSVSHVNFVMESGQWTCQVDTAIVLQNIEGSSRVISFWGFRWNLAHDFETHAIYIPVYFKSSVKEECSGYSSGAPFT